MSGRRIGRRPGRRRAKHIKRDNKQLCKNQSIERAWDYIEKKYKEITLGCEPDYCITDDPMEDMTNLINELRR
jgi:hypothetical protein